jgi:AcrR family transcriptional regulator
MSSEISKRSGRRPGPTTTREAIAEAARRQFAELGYDRTTMRGIASEAGVDAALVVRFYGSKDGLFRDVMALPPMVAEAIAGLADGPRETVGRRLAEAIVGMLENPRSRPVIVGRIRSATSAGSLRR